MSGVNTIKCENCNTLWPETMIYCQRCHRKLKEDEKALNEVNESKNKSYSKDTELSKLRKKYDLSEDYMNFLQDEYPNSSIQELEQAIREVLKETSPEQVKDGVLQVTCWNCHTKLSSKLNICPSCGIEFLSAINYSVKEKSGSEKTNMFKKDSMPKGVIFAIVIAGFDALVSIVSGIILFPQGFGLFSLIFIIVGSIELVFVIGVSSRSFNSYIGLIFFIIFSILLDLMQAMTLLSIQAGNYSGGVIIASAFFGLLINIILDILVIYGLVVNGKYFEQGNYHLVG